MLRTRRARGGFVPLRTLRSHGDVDKLAHLPPPRMLGGTSSRTLPLQYFFFFSPPNYFFEYGKGGVTFGRTSAQSQKWGGALAFERSDLF